MKRLKITKQITIRESEALEKYLSEIAKTTLLTPEEEAELAARAKKGDIKALEKLINANLRFVVSVAKQYQNKGLSLSDLISEGNIGLIKAAKHFDETKGFKFISYAVWWIRQQIMQALAENARLVRLPVNKLGSYNKVRKTVSRLSQELKRNPTTEEVSEAMELDSGFVMDALMHNDNVMSLDAPVIREDSELRLIDLISNDDYSADKDLKQKEYTDTIERLLGTLKPRDAEIIRMYYGIGKSHKYTLDEIGAHFNLTRERVRQIKNKAMQQLKKNIKFFMVE